MQIRKSTSNLSSSNKFSGENLSKGKFSIFNRSDKKLFEPDTEFTQLNVFEYFDNLYIKEFDLQRFDTPELDEELNYLLEIELRNQIEIDIHSMINYSHKFLISLKKVKLESLMINLDE